MVTLAEQRLNKEQIKSKQRAVSKNPRESEQSTSSRLSIIVSCTPSDGVDFKESSTIATHDSGLVATDDD